MANITRCNRCHTESHIARPVLLPTQDGYRAEDLCNACRSELCFMIARFINLDSPAAKTEGFNALPKPPE